MTEIQEIINQIPIRHNWISMIMLGGIIQGFLICLVIALRSRSGNQPIRLLGWFLFLLSIIGLDVYLCYTGLIKYVLWANDSTEVFVILLGPTIYFFVLSLLQKADIQFKKYWIHFLAPALFLLSQIGYLLQPDAVKLNAYIGAYFQDSLPFASYQKSSFLDFSKIIKNKWRYILLSSIFTYLFLSSKVIWRFRSGFQLNFLPDASTNKYSFSKNTIWLFAGSFLIIFIVYLNFESDLGDHYIALFFSISIYLIAFLMLSESRFFEKSWLSDKYDTSGFNKESEKTLQLLTEFIETETYYLQKNGSLKDLSTQLNIPSNYLSQVINKQTGHNFNDFINRYRIDTAKRRLNDSAFAHLSIAGIGASVGFNSKSAFYSAFKKHTQMTPAVYLKSIQSDS